jgi:uncharacterized protein
MKIAQSFTVGRPADVVWTFFQDIPAVAACLPGAELVESKPDGVQRGKVKVNLGPFKATFEGEAKVTTDPTTRSGHVDGHGIDKRGGSHSRMALDYRLKEVGNSTQVDIDVDLTLSGPIAQFGRVGLVTEVANVLIGEFTSNLDGRLSQSPEPSRVNAAPRQKQLSAWSILVAVIRNRLKMLFGGAQG